MQFFKKGFTKTIKFRLSIVFTIILFVVSGTIILLFNIAIDDYLSTREIGNNGAEPPPREEVLSDDVRALYSNNLESIKTKSIASLPLLAILYFAMGYCLAGRFLRPLKNLNSQIAELKSNNLGNQIRSVSDDEIGETIASFNEMSVRLRTSFDEQSRFVQDASHELRTPLTIVRTNVESVLDDDTATKENLMESMRNVLIELDSITALANDLLTLSRPQSKIRNEESVTEIMHAVLSSSSDIAKKVDVAITSDILKDDAYIFVNKRDVVRAITNIIDNAIKYAQYGDAESRVFIKSYVLNNNVIIEISDNGPGIPNKDLTNIFERFYRVDGSRQRQTGGFGLGLPIAKKIISEHGGKISAVSSPGKTVFVISLPIHRVG
ncbi:MAG: HAMP domain-containing sensor histidine kinase [bacterium]